MKAFSWARGWLGISGALSSALNGHMGLAKFMFTMGLINFCLWAIYNERG